MVAAEPVQEVVDAAGRVDTEREAALVGGRRPELRPRRDRLFHSIVRPGRVRLVVPAQDKDVVMKTKSIHLGTTRACAAVARRSRVLAMTAAILIGGSPSAFACPVCFGGDDPGMRESLNAGIGVLGYVLAKLECEPAPLLLGFVLGPLLEEHLRRAMLLARGDPTLFVTRPISLAFMIGTALVFVAMVWPALKTARLR